MTTTKRAALLLFLLLTLLLTLAGAAQARTYDAEEARFLQLINNYRAQQGRPALKISDTLSEASARHSLDMGRYRFFSHTTQGSSWFPAGSTPWDRMRRTGYTYNATMGENIAGGQSTAQQVFDAWRASSEHRANMLNSSFRVIGVARRVVSGSPYTSYWTTDLGSYVDSSAHDRIVSEVNPFTDVTKADLELWNAGWYVRNKGLFDGYGSGALGAWERMTHRHVALVLKRAGLGSRASWEQDYSPATRGEVRAVFPGLSWESARLTEPILRSQLVRLLYRAR